MKRRFGPQLNSEGALFSLWAPSARSVEVLVDGSGAEPCEVALNAEKQGWYEGFVAGVKAGARYRFRLDGKQMIADPASRWQPEGIAGPSVVVDAGVFAWAGAGAQFVRPRFRDLVIYELHVGTFTAEGSFRAAAEKLGHLKELGVTAIQLMPIGEFAGERNWGYDGVFLFAPFHGYGAPDDLRALVKAAHAHGLAVILDVVYNHFGPAGNSLAACVEGYLDENAKTPWGGAIRYGDPDFLALRHMILDNVAYWMDDFRVDGFRLDATHAIVDGSPRHLLQEITTAIHARGGYAIAEDPRNDVLLLKPAAAGGMGFDGVWADDFHHVVRVGATGESEGYFGDFTGTPEELVTTLDSGWLYRGQTAKSTGAARGTFCQEAPPQGFIHCISNHDQTGNHPYGSRLGHLVSRETTHAAAALLCLSPYTPMLFMGQEWDASTPFQFFVDHAPELNRLIDEGRREEFKHFAAFADEAATRRIPAPHHLSTFQDSKLKWEERESAPHLQTLRLYQACLRLRFAHAALRPDSRMRWKAYVAGKGIGMVLSCCETENLLLVFDLKGGQAASLEIVLGLGVSGMGWQKLLSTTDVEFGGSGVSGVDPRTLQCAFTVPETVLLRAVKRKQTPAERAGAD